MRTSRWWRKVKYHTREYWESSWIKTAYDWISPAPGRARPAFWLSVSIFFLNLSVVYRNPVFGIYQAIVIAAVVWGLRAGHAWAAVSGACMILLPIVQVGQLLAEGANFESAMLAAALVPGFTILFCSALLIWAAKGIGFQAGPEKPWVALAVFYFIVGIYLRPLIVPSASMEDTLVAGDEILVNRLSYPFGWFPQRGDVVAHHIPTDPNVVQVKRVIGLPGDRIRFARKQLHINGFPLIETYVRNKTDYIDAYRDDFPYLPLAHQYVDSENMLAKNVKDSEVVVPSDSIFVLGDNRDLSLDSRYYGFLTRRLLIGKALLIVSSFEPRGAKQGGELEPSIRTMRWNRVFRLVQ